MALFLQKINHINVSFNILNYKYIFDDNHEDAYFARGYSKGELKNYSGSISDYNKALEINPKNATSYLNRGLMKSYLDNHFEAISDFTKAIETDSKKTDAYVNRGFSKLKVGDKKGACKDYKKTKSLGFISSINDIWIENNCKNKGFGLFQVMEVINLLPLLSNKFCFSPLNT